MMMSLEVLKIINGVEMEYALKGNSWRSFFDLCFQPLLAHHQQLPLQQVGLQDCLQVLQHKNFKISSFHSLWVRKTVQTPSYHLKWQKKLGLLKQSQCQDLDDFESPFDPKVPVDLKKQPAFKERQLLA